MRELRGTKTERDLEEAFTGESQAHNNDTYIAAFLQETIEDEKEQAKLWFNKLNGIKNTIENLMDEAACNIDEWTDMYLEMAADAREEGFENLARLLESIAGSEKERKERRK